MTCLEIQRISKSFPGVKALTNVSFKIHGGQVHALVGENGAGKSTLMNILSGNLQADEGNILIDDELITLSNPKHAGAIGIGIVHQERSLVEGLTVAENIFTENQPKNFLGLIDRKRLHQSAKELLDRLGIRDILTHAIVARLAPGQKQMIEIAKALASPCKILILDEPTASISYQDAKVLFAIIGDLKRLGVAIIYISHRMNEIQEIGDVVSVLKDGKYQGTVDAQTTPIHQIIGMMVGRELPIVDYAIRNREKIILNVQALTGKRFSDITFQVHKGEIFGFAGLVGAGRTELAKAIFGDEPPLSGRIYKGERQIKPVKPYQAISEGIVYVPEERISQGIFPEMSLEDNIIVSWQRNTWWDDRKNRITAEKYVSLLKIRTPSLGQKMNKLSGGNQQKVILARWLSVMPELLIINEPTHGVDVGSKFEIYEMLKKLAGEGMSILLISSELPELLLLSDRVAVMRGGKLKKILNRDEATEESIMHYASG